MHLTCWVPKAKLLEAAGCCPKPVAGWLVAGVPNKPPVVAPKPGGFAC